MSTEQSTTEPKHTLYINNLNQSIKLREIKSKLTPLFSMYGNVLSVEVRKALRMRGQAFVVFDKVESAQTALEKLQNHVLFERPMVCSIQKTLYINQTNSCSTSVIQEKNPI